MYAEERRAAIVGAARDAGRVEVAELAGHWTSPRRQSAAT